MGTGAVGVQIRHVEHFVRQAGAFGPEFFYQKFREGVEVFGLPVFEGNHLSPRP